jgi:hypothetical protein
MTDDEQGLSPPWVSFRTLLSQIERMEKEGIPSQIDTHFLVGMAGGTQNHFRHALRSLGLIDDDNRPTESLYEMVENPDQRPELFRKVLLSRFPKFAQLPENASRSDFFAVLDGYGVKGEDQRRKVLSFYVYAADYAGVPVSPHIRPTKSHPGPRKTGTKRKRTGASTRTGANTNGDTSSNTGDRPRDSTPGDALSVEEMRGMYFKLLLKKAESDDGDDGDLLNRIERLVGMEPGKEQARDRDTARSTPATATGPASQGEG